MIDKLIIKCLMMGDDSELLRWHVTLWWLIPANKLPFALKQSRSSSMTKAYQQEFPGESIARPQISSNKHRLTNREKFAVYCLRVGGSEAVALAHWNAQVGTVAAVRKG